MNAAIEPFERPALNDWTGGAGEEISVNIQYNNIDIISQIVHWQILIQYEI